ncbi:Leucine rich repeat variant [Streptoalloteichus hindustanus]|uniref:Leucine rich repeat variant n=2 Tax=Streptoalloteichus hindustanus TaxID=2017 RepID=A0A1M5MJ51_STRHI|nr:Leucine rich repeat variant [Streptoalloteichus hindustanus]
MLCRDVYQGGCDRPLVEPTWCHDDEWQPDVDGRPTGPYLRRGLPEALIRTLARSQEHEVRQAVGLCQDAPEDVIDELVGDPDEDVRNAALGQTRSARLLHEAIAAWPHGPWRTRMAVASNPRCPTDILELLSRDPETMVRMSVVTNRATPEHVVDARANDPGYAVRSLALSHTRNPALIRTAAASADEQDRQRVAENPNCPANLLENLAADPAKYVRFSVASNPACPRHVRRKLESDLDPFVANMARTRR